MTDTRLRKVTAYRGYVLRNEYLDNDYYVVLPTLEMAEELQYLLSMVTISNSLVTTKSGKTFEIHSRNLQYSSVAELLVENEKDFTMTLEDALKEYGNEVEVE